MFVLSAPKLPHLSAPSHLPIRAVVHPNQNSVEMIASLLKGPVYGQSLLENLFDRIERPA